MNGINIYILYIFFIRADWQNIWIKLFMKNLYIHMWLTWEQAQLLFEWNFIGAQERAIIY